jgi:hypothetical protein
MAFLPVAPPGASGPAPVASAGVIADVVLHGVSGRPAGP